MKETPLDSATSWIIYVEWRFCVVRVNYLRYKLTHLLVREVKTTRNVTVKFSSIFLLSKVSKNNNSSINSRLIYLTERKESKLYFILTAFNNTSYLNQQTVWFRPFVLYFTRLSSRRFRSYSFFTVWLKKTAKACISTTTTAGSVKLNLIKRNMTEDTILVPRWTTCLVESNFLVFTTDIRKLSVIFLSG